VAPGFFTSARNGDELLARVAWTAGRYYFVRDSAFTANRLPGAPAHVVQGELAYRHSAGLTLRPSIEWVPGSYSIDSANTVENEGWLVAHFRGELELPHWSTAVFVEVRNVTNARYSPAVTVDDAAGRFYLPGEPRSVYAGLQWHR
jgi:iron complex outermembrane receptor protein